MVANLVKGTATIADLTTREKNHKVKEIVAMIAVSNKTSSPKKAAGHMLTLKPRAAAQKAEQKSTLAQARNASNNRKPKKLAQANKRKEPEEIFEEAARLAELNSASCSSSPCS